MKRLFLTPLILGFFSPVNAGIYYYPSYQDGIEVRCKDGKPKHLVEITKSGRGLKLEGHGDNQYSWPITFYFQKHQTKNINTSLLLLVLNAAFENLM